ncbi:hypothetical protein HPB47_020820 [Ixodes persulcatus]|uniref:Uncharacterized protein n=1 Tax=Ixodes persulcatus TaxID=34615 RepID=A0AC60QEB3_IXOPE|nr:hypothetical protein HPB47_020820 [Ixodes persulcatus]
MTILSALTFLLVICMTIGNQLTTVSNNLGFDLLRALPTSKEGNIFFSPYGVSCMVGMLFAGSQGKSNEILFRQLKFPAFVMTSSDVLGAFAQRAKETGFVDALWPNLQVAEAVLIDESFNVSYIYEKTLRRSFGAALLKVNFQKSGRFLVKYVNVRVQRHTGYQIREFVDHQFDPETKLVLLNAIYFKGAWNALFSKKNTTKRQFLNDGVTGAQVDTMSNTFTVNYAVSKVLNAVVVDLPYRSNNLSMTILLPRENDGVDRLKHCLTGQRFRNLVSDMHSIRAAVCLPRFRLEIKYSLTDPLKSVGINEIFSDSADLSGISTQGNLNVSGVEHKAVVEVNEEGSEASSSTSGLVSKSVETLKFWVDHPFLFFIRNTVTQDILFMGQVNRL